MDKNESIKVHKPVEVHQTIKVHKPVEVHQTIKVEKNILTDSLQAKSHSINNLEQSLVEESSPPSIIKNNPPIYPKLAKRLGYEGRVVLKVWINAKGDLSNIKIVSSSGYKILDNSALKAVRKYRFEPAKSLGNNVSDSFEVPVNFILR